MAQIITALRGDPILSQRWQDVVRQSGQSHRPIVAVNNAADEVIAKAVNAIMLPVAPFVGGSETKRVQYIADIYDELLKMARTEWVYLLDDDVLPPFGGFSRLSRSAASTNDDVAGVVTVYPFKGGSPDELCLFFRPFGIAASLASMPSSGLHQVWGGGTGFSLWRKALLMGTLPWKALDTEGIAHGWDRDLAIKLEKAVKRVMVDAAIRCRHDNLPE